MSIAERLHQAGIDWIVPAWPAPPNVQGFATTRNGGTWAGMPASLDMGPADPATLEDDARRAAILASRARVREFLPSQPLWSEQVHGSTVTAIDALNLGEFRSHAPIGDAVVTRLVDVPLAIRVADCIPVLLADDAGAVVGAAHAGWRGLAAGVLEAAVAGMEANPASLVAWLGPAIGPLAFEVGDDVRDALCNDDAHASVHFKPIAGGKWMADLPAIARRRLRAAGVSRVTGGEHCTWTDAARFHSHRRDRTAARMAAFVWRSGPR